MSFPVDDYTPYGYLDLPGHTRRLSPKGVMRSDGVGFRWHFPALVAAYGGAGDHYQAGIRLRDGVPADFVAPYHSSKVITFAPKGDDAGPVLTWFMVNDDCLAVRITGRPGAVVPMIVEYERTVAADGGWGESGLVGRTVESEAVLQSFEDGDAFVLRASCDLTIDFGSGGQSVTVLGSRGDRVGLTGQVNVSLPDRAEESVAGWVLLGRGRTEREARANLPRADEAAARLDDQLRCDADFWADAPVLDGDWPDHWRRGLVYDLETLRMMIKEPSGIYRHRWDAMQIQSPRLVLAEAAMDALSLSWARPDIAAELLLGTFADAPEPHVPCSREDGSYNMVAADGTVCGTGPQWGYPFLVAQRLAQALDDPTVWVAEVYRPMADYLRWWLSERTDADGWLVHACSWESGQDLSPRFGDQPLGGGHPTRHLRPADLHAAAAHAAAVLAGFAAKAAPEEVEGWQAISVELTERSRRLWNGSRFADFDRDAGSFTEIDDPMLFAAPALGIASNEQIPATVRALTMINSKDLVWPMFVWTPALAANAVGRPDLAGALAGDIIDRAYRHWDNRHYDASTTLPGIASEYWPEHGRCGGEGYGWGAFTTELLLSHVVGLRITDDGVELAPSFPQQLAVPGSRYGLTVTARGHRLQFTFMIDDQGRVDVSGPEGHRLDGAVAHWTWRDLR